MLSRYCASLAFVALLLGACVTTPSIPLRTTVDVEDDPFESFVLVRGPHGEFAEGDFFIRSWVERDSEADPEHQVYISLTYRYDWRTYYRAALEGGAALEVTEINSDVSCSGGCTYYEALGVDLSHEMLLQRRESGVALKIFSRSGHDALIVVTPAMIEAQISATDSIQG